MLAPNALRIRVAVRLGPARYPRCKLSSRDGDQNSARPHMASLVEDVLTGGWGASRRPAMEWASGRPQAICG
jgi:hypothetical protein